ncbi:hypothetical protein VCR1J2_590029 [Vibrio coralliirubri]|nr:hypothetical protein VCR1J2_590029 [Vibrio coralliirubri]
MLANSLKKGPATKVATETPKIVERLDIMDSFSVEEPFTKSFSISFIKPGNRIKDHMPAVYHTDMTHRNLTPH